MKFEDKLDNAEHADITLSMQEIFDFVLAYSMQRQTQTKILAVMLKFTSVDAIFHSASLLSCCCNDRMYVHTLRNEL